MKHNRKLIRRIIWAADLPPELDPHSFFVQWIGSDECLIEQHRGILCFTLAEIRFSTEQGVLTVSGEELALEQMTAARAKICGKICSVTLEAKS